MAVTNFVPDIWSGLILSNLSKVSVAAAVCNRDYEGEIRGGGDSVKITSITDPTVGSYTAHSDITIEDVDDATRSLTIDHLKYFAFEVDDLERTQSVNGGALIAEATRRAAYGLANALDTAVLSEIANGASNSAPDHDIAEQTVSTAAGAYDLLVDMSVMLDQADVPEQDRFAVVSPSFYGKILKDSRFIADGSAAGSATRANGRVGQAAGLDVYKSNNLPAGPGAGAGYYQIVGYRGATTLAEQILNVEGGRMEKRFADYVRGLHAAGFKTVRPTGVVAADVIVS